MISLARTLTTGEIDLLGHLYQDAEKQEIAAYLRNFLDFVNVLHAVFEGDDHTDSTAYDLGQCGDGWKLFADFVLDKCFYSRIFRTQNGAFGLEPACLREGDVITELDGAHIPYA
jgi:hypothetical protein